MTIYTVIFDHWSEPASYAASFSEMGRAVEYARTFFLDQFYGDIEQAIKEGDLDITDPEHRELIADLETIKKGPCSFLTIEDAVRDANMVMTWTGRIELFESELIE